ncbi:DUF924 family protein [Qipengyuania sp.]|uniref:DUF924 family protein n=1 Tax=Qipengyuania sp. TaxID=2004515 RepID=UPI0035C815F1
MTAASRRWAAEILFVWFGKLGPGDWWGGSDGVDAMLHRRFEHDLAMLGNDRAGGFLSDPLTAQAAILLFDQVPRNLYRNDARAFVWDPLARAIAYGMMKRGWDRELPRRERPFVYMPLMHSEHIADQRASLTMFTRHAPDNLGFARDHYRMITRFGRFPHRNAILGRKSTKAEKAAVEAGFSW